MGNSGFPLAHGLPGYADLVGQGLLIHPSGFAGLTEALRKGHGASSFRSAFMIADAAVARNQRKLASRQLTVAHRNFSGKCRVYITVWKTLWRMCKTLYYEGIMKVTARL